MCLFFWCILYIVYSCDKFYGQMNLISYVGAFQILFCLCLLFTDIKQKWFLFIIMIERSNFSLRVDKVVSITKIQKQLWDPEFESGWRRWKKYQYLSVELSLINSSLTFYWWIEGYLCGPINSNLSRIHPACMKINLWGLNALQQFLSLQFIYDICGAYHSLIHFAWCADLGIG
jgi:hypothetical protein